MDAKISEFPTISSILAADILPVVSEGANKKVTVGVLALNLPNFGNKGITKNIVTPITSGAIPITKTLVSLTGASTSYTLASGSPGQEITLVALAGMITVIPSTSLFQSASMNLGSTLTLLFVSDSWFPKSYHNCTFNT